MEEEAKPRRAEGGRCERVLEHDDYHRRTERPRPAKLQNRNRTNTREERKVRRKPEHENKLEEESNAQQKGREEPAPRERRPDERKEPKTTDPGNGNHEAG